MLKTNSRKARENVQVYILDNFCLLYTSDAADERSRPTPRRRTSRAWPLSSLTRSERRNPQRVDIAG